MKNLETYMTVKDYAIKNGITVQGVHKRIKKGRVLFKKIASIYLVKDKL
jgi:hypothetical protein